MLKAWVARKKELKDYKTIGWGELLQTHIFSTSHKCCTSELTTATATCTNPAQGHTSQLPHREGEWAIRTHP